jgi:phosphoribosylformimino-5-aminoimidazole carboxamide ribonucleotide (ProFAR) isomerase
MRAACAATDVPIIASGGVTSAADIRALRDLPLFGIITGKAIYEGKLTIADALAALTE